MGARLWILIFSVATMANLATAQFSFYSPQVLDPSAKWGEATNDNTGVIPDVGAPSVAGSPPNAPLWYQWTAPQDGVVELDTVGSSTMVTNYYFTYDPILLSFTLTTNISPALLDTVVGVYTGTNISTLSQVVANDDLYPVNSTIEPYIISASTDYANSFFFQSVFGLLNGYQAGSSFYYIPPYHGPSHTRFNVKGGATYYFDVDTKFSSSTGPVVLNWAYKSSGVFRFATEDFDSATQLPLYQTAQTESQPPSGTGNDANSTVLTYYQYNAPGTLVTVTRTAGSTGRVMVDYNTVDGTDFSTLPPNDQPATAGVDYQPVSGTLIFDDYEMSKTILIPILSRDANFFGGTPFDQSNRVFGVTLSNPRPDPYEVSDLAPPRLDSVFSTAMVKILNVNANPYGPSFVPVVDTNVVPAVTNFVETAYPTNVIFNFEKANYRVPADVNNSVVSPWTQVTVYVRRYGTNTAAQTLNYRVNSYIEDNFGGDEQMNNQFPLQPGSDYAVPTPPDWPPIRGTNSDFVMAEGTISFPNKGAGASLQPIRFTVPTSTLTKFNKDFKIQLYKTVDNAAVLVGMVAETTVTILFNDQNPPAGSVDEMYNPDFNSELALYPNQVPSSTPPSNPNPGVGLYGQVYSMVTLGNDETFIGGNFASYNGLSMSSVALLTTNGAPDPNFNSGSGVNGDVNAVGTFGGQLYIAGSFSSYDGTQAGNVARLNMDGSIDSSFATGTGADGPVRAMVVLKDGSVLIGGEFTHVNGVERHYLAKLNTNGSVNVDFNPGNTLDGPVFSLALPVSFSTTTLNFNISPSGGSDEQVDVLNLGTATSGILTVNYDMLAQPDDMKIFYGTTNTPGGTGVLIYDTTPVSGVGTIVLPFGPTNGLTASALSICMNQGGGQSGTFWSYTASVQISQNASTNSQVMVGGQFAVSGQTYANIARFDQNSGLLDTTFNPGTGPNGKVLALAMQTNDQVVAGGEFTSVNGSVNNHIARFNVDGSASTTGFYAGSGADGVVRTLKYQPLDGTIYVGGFFSEFNGTHRRGFTRLYANGTVDTTFMDTAYNQFAGLKRIYSDDLPGVVACSVESTGNVLIGGAFNQVGGGQASATSCNTLDTDLQNAIGDPFAYTPSFNDPYLWVEPKTRDGFRTRSGFARLIGGATPGPGNLGFNQSSYSQNKSQTSLNVSLVRTNGILGPISADFSVQEGTARSGVDYNYNGSSPTWWVAWDYLTHPSRVRSDGLSGASGFLYDPYGLYLGLADASINNLSKVLVSIINNKNSSGDLNAKFQLSNPSTSDQFYLGSQVIPVGGALGIASAPFKVIDDTSFPGTFGFSSPSFVATNLSAPISILRSNGSFGTVTVRYSTTNGTAIIGTDYDAITNGSKAFAQGIVSNGFNITIKNNGIISTGLVEKTINLRIHTLQSVTPGAAFGISNAVLRLINPNSVGYVTLGNTNYNGNISSGVLNFVVNRIVGSKGTISVKYGTTNGTAINGIDYIGSTNTLTWDNGDVTPRTIAVPLLNPGVVGANKQFGVRLFEPSATNGIINLALMGTISNASLTINNDNSYGALQLAASSYFVSERGGYATITVVRTGGAVGTVSVDFATSDGPNTQAGVNYTATNGTLSLAPNVTSASFTVPVSNDGVVDPTDAFYFNVTLSNPVNCSLVSPTVAQVNILDADTFNWPPGSLDPGFVGSGMNGSVFALALDADGKILAGGNFTKVGSTARNHMARLNTDGSLDTAFLDYTVGLDGVDGAVNSIALQTDGRILIGGAFTTVNGVHRNFVSRLMTDGSLDTSFNPGSGADSVVNAVAETFIGGVRKLYAGGGFVNYNGSSSAGIVRLNNNGTLDNSFNIGTGVDGQVNAIAVYPTNSLNAGKILIGGSFAHVNGVTIANLARLNVDGSLDTNFNAILGSGPDGVVRSLVIQMGEEILVGGGFTNFNGTVSSGITRLKANGSLDASFVAAIGAGAQSSVNDIVLQPDNRIVVVGQFTAFSGLTRNHITRLLPSGAADPSINFGSGANGNINAVVCQATNGMLVIGGGFTEYAGESHANIARIYGGSVTGSGEFQFTSANYLVNENGILAAITISRTGGSAGPNADGSGTVNVTFATSDGTAVNGVNYIGITNVVAFPVGEVLKTVTLPVFDDLALTPDLTVNLALSNPTLPADISVVQPTATLTIINVDSGVNFSNAFPIVFKNVPSGVADVQVVRTGGGNTTSTVDFYATTNGTAVAGTDFYPTNGTITFGAGQSVATIQVPVINTNIPRGNRTIPLFLTNAVNTILLSPSNASLTIIDTVAAPGQLYFGATNYTVSSANPSAFLTVLRTNGSSGSVTVNYNTVPGTALPGANYVTSSGILTFGSGETSKNVVIPLVNNNIAQPPVSLSVVLSNPSGGATLTAPTNTTLTIINTNIGYAFVSGTNYVREINGTVSIFVQRIGGTNGGVSVDYATQDGTAYDGTNYDAISGTLTFAGGETLKSISLPLRYDPAVTGDLNLLLKLSNPSSGTLLGTPSTSVIVVQDADAGINFTNSVMSVLKNSGNAVIAVVCGNPSIEPTGADTNIPPWTVNYATADGTALAGLDYQATSGKLYFTNGIGTNFIVVPIMNNTLVTGDHTFSVSLFNVTPPAQLLAPSNMVVTIVNNNSGLNFSSPSYSVQKTGVAATMTVLRRDYTNTTSSVNFATANGSAVAGTDYIATNGVLVFTNGETSKTFSVTVIASTAVQPDKTVLLQLYNPTNGFLIAPYAATLTIHDNTGSLVVPAGSALLSENLVTNGIIDPAETVSLLLALRASGGTNIPSVYATLLSTNGITSPSPATAVSYGSLTVGGASVSRPFTFTASGTNGQTIAATLQLNNGVTNIGTAVFTYTLGTWTNTFYNTNAIVINDHAIASPYPSSIAVSNVGGALVKSTVLLTNFYHGYTKDVEVLLVSPAGQDTLLMSHAGNAKATKITLMFDDAATNSLPDNSALVSGTNKPSAYQSTTTFP